MCLRHTLCNSLARVLCGSTTVYVRMSLRSCVQIGACGSGRRTYPFKLWGRGEPSCIHCQSPGRHQRPVGARRYLMPCIYSYYYLVDHRANAKEMLGIVVWCGRWSHTKDRMQRASILYEQALDGRLSPAHSFLLHRLKSADK